MLTSRREVIAYYSDLRDAAGDWKVEAIEIIDAGQGRFVVHQRGHFEGRASRISGEQESFQVWELGADGLVERLQEYETRPEALEAAGFEE